MSHLTATLLAYFLNSISVSINKILLNKSIPDPFVYVFYVSIFSLILIPILPFTSAPTQTSIALSSFSTIFWTIGAYCMFKALKVGQVSRVIPVIGTLIPLILLLQSSGSETISINQFWAVGFLVLGLILITILDWKGKVDKQEVLFEVLSAVFFALSYILLRQSYINENFLSVLVYSRLILIPFVAICLLLPTLKKRILASRGQKIKIFTAAGMIFLFGQIAGGASEILLRYSISLASPALVNSLAGTQYIFLLIFGFFLKERYSKKSLVLKICGIIFIAMGLFVLSYPKTADQNIGITFSPKYAKELKLDPKLTFDKVLNDFNIKFLRIPIYWDEVEVNEGNYNFSDVDYYLDQSLKKNVKVILVLGYKQPRWPECFSPTWAKKLIRNERDLRVLKLVQAEIEHFKKYPNIIAWQIENEPFLTYGNCDKVNEETEKRVKNEINIVKAADSRPIIITDSGELGIWNKAFKFGDIFGTTLYRDVWNPYFGYSTYPLPPIFYSLKSDLMRIITGKNVDTVISELQMEPWITDQNLPSMSFVEEQRKNFPIDKLGKYL